MRKTVYMLLCLALTLVLLCSCGERGSDLSGIAASLEPPLRITARITSGAFDSQAEICFYVPDADVTMSVVFTSPDPFTGLKVERHSDGKLYASYDGLLSELDDSALNIVAVTGDVLQAVRTNLSQLGTPVEPDDERYAQAEIVLDAGTIVLYYDEATSTLLRIKSDLFDVPVTVDLMEYEKITPPGAE